jgi:hypothetical protein
MGAYYRPFGDSSEEGPLITNWVPSVQGRTAQFLSAQTGSAIAIAPGYIAATITPGSTGY